MKRTFTLLSALVVHLNTTAQTVSTLASLPSGVMPAGLAVGKLDTIYVAGLADFRIYKIAPTGAYSVFAGSGVYGLTDSTGTDAQVTQIYDMEYSTATGNLYFLDYNISRLRKVSPDGKVSTLATISEGVGLAIGQNDTLYTYGYSSGALNKVDPISGSITFMNNLPAYGMGLTYVSPDTIYLAGYNTNVIYQVDRTGAYTTLAGSGSAGNTDATGTAASFYYPMHVAVDGNGNLFVTQADSFIRKVTPAGVVSRHATITTSGGSVTFMLGAGIGRESGNLYTADYSNAAVRTVSGVVPLPLEWISYDASLNAQKNAVIRWTAKERGVQNYQVQKSTDGTHFQHIGTLNARGDGEHSYSFTEAQPLTGTAYYRIRQTDVAGNSSHSATLSLQHNGRPTTSARVYPTLCTDGFSIETAAAQQVSVFNQQGQLIQQLQLIAGTTFLPTANWPSGSYHLQFTDGTTTTVIRN